MALPRVAPAVRRVLLLLRGGGNAPVPAAKRAHGVRSKDRITTKSARALRGPAFTRAAGAALPDADGVSDQGPQLQSGGSDVRNNLGGAWPSLRVLAAACVIAGEIVHFDR